MQLTTINKIISYLLVGSLATALLLVLYFENINNFFTKEENSELLKSIGVLIPLIFLAIAAFLGLVIEGIRQSLSIFLSPLLTPKESEQGKTPWIMVMLGLSIELKECQEGFKLFYKVFKDEQKKYQEVAKIDEGEDHWNSSLCRFAVSLFFEKVKPDTLNWAASHYATYILASGFLILAILWGPLWCLYTFSSVPNCQYVLIWIAALYALARLSISMYLYTWDITFRQTYIILKDSAQSSDENE